MRDMPLFVRLRRDARFAAPSDGPKTVFDPSPEEVLQSVDRSHADAASFHRWVAKSMNVAPPVEHAMLAIGGQSHIQPTDPAPFAPPAKVKRVDRVFADTVPFSEASERLCHEQLLVSAGALVEGAPSMKWVQRTMLPMARNYVGSSVTGSVGADQTFTQAALMTLRDPMPFEDAEGRLRLTTTLTAVHLSENPPPAEDESPKRMYEFPSTFSHLAFRDTPSTYHHEDRIFSTLPSGASPVTSSQQALPAWAATWSCVPIGGHTPAADKRSQEAIRAVLFDGLELDGAAPQSNPFVRRPRASPAPTPMRWVSFQDS
jgi:hypothetical protein